ncbi:MAG: hypothetical protein IPN32_27600 [Deltaproteobacteria bacterium]|nr:hypothetical protein [Deltaproteobacteria bacterium]
MVAIGGCGDAQAVAPPPRAAPAAWTRASEAARCGATVASDAALAMLTPSWASCGEGCRVTTADGSFVVGGHEPVRSIDGVPYLVATAFTPDLGRWTTSVGPLGAAPVFAISHRLDADDGCTARVAVGDDGLAVALHVDGSLADELLVDLDRGAPRVVAMDDVVVGLAVGDTAAWVGLDHMGLRRADGAVVTDGWVHPRAIDDAIIVRSVDGHRLGRIADGVLTPWTSSPRATSEVTLDRARARVIWIEADEVATGFHDPSLWSATTRGDDRRAHGAVPGGDGRGGWGMVADDDRVLVIDGPDHAWVTPLDGSPTIDLRPPVGLGWIRPLWIDAHEAWLLAGPPHGRANAIVRRRWR